MENRLESVQWEKRAIRKENYQLHLDLIKRDNPYRWELYGDAIGNWGYRRADENAILGAVGYIYLTNE
ncbi:MAG: hypothetical protein V1729_00535 [Candidatus Woesearchaeota archaeon]